jgi:hypothetical protein
MSLIPNSISPVQVRPVADPKTGPSFYWYFDNAFTATPIVEDINSDGKDDLIFLPSNYRTNTNSYDQDGVSWPTYKFILYESNGDGTFSERTADRFPGGQWIGMSGTRYIFKDLNGDQIKDFMVIDQGYESISKTPLKKLDMDIGNSIPGSPWFTEQNHQGAVLSWWEGKRDGKYIRHDITKDKYMAFHHNGDAADIDLDGKLEIVIANAGAFSYVSEDGISTFLSPKPNSTLVSSGAFADRVRDIDVLALGMRPLIPLKMDGAGDYRLNFGMVAQDDSQHPINLPLTPFQMLVASTTKFADLNGDSYPEMIVGVGITYSGADTFNRIYINKNGSYSVDDVIRLPFPVVATDLANRNSAVFIDTADIDKNGLLDIAIGYENPGNGAGAGHFIQIFSQTSRDAFVDITSQSIGSYVSADIVKKVRPGDVTSGMAAPSWLRFEDINNDGHADLVFLSGPTLFSEMPAFYLVNDGKGKFSPINSNFFVQSNLRRNTNDTAFNKLGYQSVVGDFNGDGITDNLTLEYDFWGYSGLDRDASFKPAFMYAQTNLKTEPYGLLASGLSTVSTVVPGMNEFFYANNNQKARSAVESGAYKSYTDHYLLVGRSSGEMICAPHTIVRGFTKSDTFTLLDSFRNVTIQKELPETIKMGGLTGYESLTFVGIERFLFTDRAVTFDGVGNAGQAYRIYKAVFDRTPDGGGLGYWIAQMDKGMDVVSVAARFIDSPEFRSLYGQNPTDAEFLTKVYSNVLDRTPDATGLGWWVNEMKTNPTKTWQKVLADFSESTENQANVTSLIADGIPYEPWVG